MTNRTERRTVAAACALVAVICLAPSVSGNLFYDDAVVVGQDGRLSGSIEWMALWNRPYWGEQLWRPLTMSVFGIQILASRLFGLADPALLMHIASLALYTTCVLCFVLVLQSLARNAIAAAIAGLFFAVHPTHVEAVAAIVGQAELLVGMAACGILLILEQARSQPRTWHLTGILALVAAGTSSKEQGFILPLVIATHLYLRPPDGASWQSRTRFLVYPFVVALSLWLLRSAVLYSGVGATPAESLGSLGVTDRLMAAVGMLPQVARLLYLPLHLAQEYSPPGVPVATGFTLGHLVGLAIIAATIWLFVWNRVRNPVIALGAAWMAISWLPVSSIVAPTGILIAERTLFLPTMGVAMMLAGGLSAVATSQRARGLCLVGSMTPVVILGSVSISRGEVWANADNFFFSMTYDQPNGYRAWFVRARYELGQGNPRGAQSLFRQSANLWPASANASEEFGALARQHGDCREAITVLDRGLRFNPNRTRMRAILVECLVQTGDSVGARRLALEGIEAGDSSFTALLRRIDRDSEQP